MKLLDLIIKEYLALVETLANTHDVENKRIVISREEFRSLLEKYAYLKFSEKTKIYKALNFLIHDQNNYTMPYKDPILKKTVRKVIINYATYEVVKHIFTIAF